MAPSEVRRDRWGRYLVVPPGGAKPQGYTRATTVAKVLDDQGGLMPWKAAMAMTGLMRRSGLRGKLEALVSAHPESGPWYGDDASKKAIKALVEECAEAGGSADRADIGTALHAIIEQVNRGQVPTISQDSTRADVTAYRDALTKYGIKFDPEYIEATVVLDKYQVAGTADGGRVYIPGYGWVVADLKTGATLEYSGQSIGVQLSIYANGDASYRQGTKPDGSDDVRLPAPDVRKDMAVVIHLPAGEGRCTFHKVDIAAGWEAFETSIWARDWRKRKDLLIPLDLDEVTTAPDAPDDEPITALNATRLTLLELIKALPADRQKVLRDSWPTATLPPLKSGEHWTPALLVECTKFIAAVATAGDTSVSPGPGAEAGTAALQSGSGEPGDAIPHSVEAFEALDAEAQARGIERGHLPDALRLPPTELDALKARVLALGSEQRGWADRQAQAIDLPSLGLPAQWSLARGAELATILDAAEQMTAEQAAPPNWAALVTAAGLTKAATLRKAKEIAGELGIEKVPATLEKLPTSGEFAVRLLAWIDEQAQSKAAAA